ncbi:MAG: hypothetical protein R3A10_20245 [Caldilineaceae bacterium]
MAYTTVLLLTATGALLSLLWYVPLARGVVVAAADRGGRQSLDKDGATCYICRHNRIVLMPC